MSERVLATVPSRLPSSLDKAPLAEAICELRFQPAAASIAQLLPGIIYGRLPKYAKSEATPFAGMPPEIRKQLRAQDPNLLYQAEYRLRDGGASVFVGECVAGVSIIEPYEGWSCFRPRILEFLEVLRDSALIGKVDRLSIKAMNIISLPGSPMDMLNVEVKVGGVKPPDKGFRVRAEFHNEPYSLIVELISGATVTFQGGENRSGHYLGLDCVREIGTESFWSIYEVALDEAHQQLKDLFFRLITPETLVSFDPRYE